MTAEEYVKSIEPTAYAATWRESFYIGIPRHVGGPKRLSSTSATEAEAWANAERKLRRDTTTPQPRPDAVVAGGAIVTNVEDYVRSVHADAYLDTWMRPDGQVFYFVAVPRAGQAALQLSVPERNPKDAWAFTEARLRREREPAPAPPEAIDAPVDLPSVALVAQYVGTRHGGISFSVGDARPPVIYALPFIFPRDGITGAVSHARMAPTFACGLCRLAADMVPGDLATKVLVASSEWAWSYTDDEQARQSSRLEAIESADRSFAVALGKAIAHLRKHGIAPEWHTVDVLDTFSGTAYGAVVLRGLGAPERPSGSSRLVVTSLQVHFRGDRLVQAMFLAERVPGIRGQRAILAELEQTRVELTPAADAPGDESRLMLYEARLDGPMTLDTVAHEVHEIDGCQQ